MKIAWQGGIYDLDLLEVTLKQAEQICLYTGCQTLEEWETQLAESRKPSWPKAVTAAWWLMTAQSGADAGRITDADIPFLKFGAALAEAYQAETGAAAEPDPTTAAALTGGTPTGATTGSGGSGGVTSASSAEPTFTPSPRDVTAIRSSSTS